MAMSKEQAKAFYDKAVEAGYDDDEIIAEMRKRNGAPASVEAAPAETPTLDAYTIKKPDPNADLEQLMGGGALDRFRGGLNRSLEGANRGARKLLAQLVGNDEQVEGYNAQEQQARDIMQKADPSGSGFSPADAGRIAGDVGQFAMGGRGIKSGAAMGATQGLLQPTTADESQVDNAVVGGVVGAAIPALLRAPSALKNAGRRIDTTEALEQFTKDALGRARGAEDAPAYAGVVDKVEDRYNTLADQFSKRYNEVEGGAAGLPPVQMNEASGLSRDALTLPEEVINALSPGAKRVAAAMQRGSTHTSPIVDTAGKPLVAPEKIGFKEVRDTVRELRKAKRAMPYTDAGVARGKQIDNITQRLEQDLEGWRGVGPTRAAATLDDARALDSAYKAEVAPFQNKDEVVGQLRRGAGDERSIDRLFMGANTGQAAQELMERVPGIEQELRQLYGSKLLQETGDTTAIRKLEGGTLGEALLKPEERAYTGALAAKMRDNKSGPGLDIPNLLRNTVRMVPGVGKKADAVMNGILPYGAKEARLPPDIIARLLRAYTTSQAAQPSEGE